MGTKGAWTPERRAKQAAIIAQTRPWENATGPRTDAGKAISSRNADTGAAATAAMFKAVRMEMRGRALLQAEHLLRRIRILEARQFDVPLDDECGNRPASE
ncbi:MAG: hypothetical protein B7Y43_18345 [Sphingomonas sp. 28-62-20]|nr:MAG: hypothetical protein B7Y43_18345 [Sphingomonas sp. 28-62-20]